MIVSMLSRFLLAICIVFVISPIVRGQGLTPALELGVSRLYVGQAIPGHVVVVSKATPPAISMGKSEGLEISTIGGAEVRPRSSSGIGETTYVENIYRFPIRILAKKPGQWAIPTIQLADAQQKATVRTRKLTVIAPPVSGRTAAFLGGVGELSAFAEIRPDVVTLGEAIEFRLRLEGMGAIGSMEPASLPVFDRLEKGWEIRPLPAESVADPPSRTFRFRLKASRATDQILGPILVSTFDPATGTYRTVATKAITLRVVDVPGFDVSTLPTVPVTTKTSELSRPGIVLGLGGLIVASSLIVAAKYLARRHRRIRASRIAESLIPALQRATGLNQLSGAILSAFGQFFGQVTGQTPAVLTPEEAGALASSLPVSEDVADELSRLIGRLDLALYASEGRGPSEEELRRQSIILLRRLASEVDADRANRRSRAAP